ncbi:MAG: hypothetical protein GX856_00935, partial [Gammaproteobacteria bacterium]|nr:hypothetical protein [Gammaproteobacteria bacterium]
ALRGAAPLALHATLTWTAPSPRPPWGAERPAPLDLEGARAAPLELEAGRPPRPPLVAERP